MKMKYLFSMFLMGIFALGFTASDLDDVINDGTTPTGNTGIPGDDLADPNPGLPDDPNTNIPNFSYTVETIDGVLVIRLDLTGVQNPNDLNDWLKLFGTTSPDQNIWISVDGQPKGFVIINNEEESEVKKVDLTFLVDNSGSMWEEADAVARDIIEWSQKLAASSLDMRFACVGYDGAISGALNFGDVNNLDDYLQYSSGVDRTYHFGGVDADDLKSKVGPYRTGGNSSNECGVAALRFAHEQFNFRPDANRVYVNFTDEPNQPAGNADYSTSWVKDIVNWPVTNGTIHTVYSDPYDFTENPLWQEHPWDLSEFTFGTTIKTNSSFQDVTLDDLPVTGALLNSYIIRFTNVDDLFDGQPHTIKITILSPDGTVRAERVITVVFTK